MRPNEDIRKALATAGLKQWELADYLAIDETKLSKMLRYELPRDEKEEVLDVIKSHAKNKSRI